MNIKERNIILCKAYEDGEPMTSISERYGISCTQLSRIFRASAIKRKVFELDLQYFEANKEKSIRSISESTNIPIKRVVYLKRIAYKKARKNEYRSLDHSNLNPTVDKNLINDRDWLFDKYVIQKCGTPTIARMLACKASDVIKQLYNFDIPLRSIKEASKLKTKRPNKDWLIEHYVNLKWSITKCAVEFNTGFQAIYSALVEFDIPTRSASEQHVGELNEFYGKEHDQDIIAYCTEMGTKHGSAYWSTGDIKAKSEQASLIAKQIWSDQTRRAEHSAKIAEICANGGCNSKQIVYLRSRDNKQFVFRSSWEYAIAICLESDDLIDDWDYECLSIPYEFEGQLKNYIIDFMIKWKNGLTTYLESKNEHLLKSEKELRKIETARDFLRKNKSNLTVIINIKDLKESSIDIKELSGTRYYCDKSYLLKSNWAKERMIHRIINRVCPWQDLTYSEEELLSDYERIKAENIELYKYQGDFRSTVPNGRGMPGRALILHYQPHFFNVIINKYRTLKEAFDDKWIIYRSILRSIEEKETLSLERLLREINFHFTDYARTSHFATGFARAIIRDVGMSGRRIFDPCCGWGGRLIGASLENCSYRGTDISPLTCDGLRNINRYIKYNADVINDSCLNVDWDGDLIFTSPPFFDIEEYVGGEQPKDRYKTREEWRDQFITPFVRKIGNTKAVLYLDKLTMEDFRCIKAFDRITKVRNKRHARQNDGFEYLCYYNTL